MVNFTETFGNGQLADHAVINIGNPVTAVASDGYLEFTTPANEAGNPITSEAEVRILLDDDSWNIWQAGGAEGSGFSVEDTTNHVLLATGPYTRLDNLHFDPGEISKIAVKVNFLTEEATDKQEFIYDVVQKDSTDSLIGGERFIITKPPRADEDMFVARGNVDNSNQQSGTYGLMAEDINEPAAYKWYTTDTTLVDTGKNITVSPTQNTAYLLEVTADTDGYKDYAQVNVTLPQPQLGSIVSLSPNPATGSVTVNYHVDSTVQTAQIKIVASNNPGQILITSSLNKTQTQASFNIGSLAPGNYVVVLYCDSQFADSKQLVVQ